LRVVDSENFVISSLGRQLLRLGAKRGGIALEKRMKQLTCNSHPAA